MKVLVLILILIQNINSQSIYGDIRNNDHIEFISASNKLKDCDLKDKTTYSDRKKLGIEKCLGIITSNAGFNEHIEYFNKHKKKDDLSDSFLQGIWFINNKKM